MFAPLQAMADWLRIAATLNPVTYILDGMRALTVTGWELEIAPLTRGFGSDDPVPVCRKHSAGRTCEQSRWLIPTLRVGAVPCVGRYRVP